MEEKNVVTLYHIFGKFSFQEGEEKSGNYFLSSKDVAEKCNI